MCPCMRVQVCARDCVYACTSNHTLAYGFSAPYDASDDYSFEDVHAAAESIDSRERRIRVEDVKNFQMVAWRAQFGRGITVG